MRVFFSCILPKSKYYLITLLSVHIKDLGLRLNASMKCEDKNIIDTHDIKFSHLFIGLITEPGDLVSEVIEDFKEAKAHGIPRILLVDSNVMEAHPEIRQLNKIHIDELGLEGEELEEYLKASEKLWESYKDIWDYEDSNGELLYSNIFVYDPNNQKEFVDNIERMELFARRAEVIDANRLSWLLGGKPVEFLLKNL